MVGAGGGVAECCAVLVVLEVGRDVNGFVKAGADEVAVAEVADPVGDEFRLGQRVQLGCLLFYGEHRTYGVPCYVVYDGHMFLGYLA